MPTPATRTPVRLARGTYANLLASIADLLEGEAVYATDQDKVYVKEGGSLVSTQADLSSYLTTASASSTYLTQANASSTYLTQASATSTYLTQANASSTYQTQAGMTGYLATGAIGTTVQAYDANTAKTNVAQAFSAPQRGSLTTLSISSGAVTINLNNTNNYYLDLTSSVSSVTFSNATAGQTGSIFVKCNGAYTIGGWPAAAKFSGGTAPTITTTSGKYDRIDYAVYDASNIHLVWTGNY